MKASETAAAAALPNDLLAGVLAILPRSVAASHGVCKSWRDLIDERQLLVRLRSLLPHSVRGLFFNYEDYFNRSTHFFSRPTSASSDGPQIDGKFNFIETEDNSSWHQVVDHCNGLVLYSEDYGRVLHVCNPATRWSARLPQWPGGGSCSYSTWFLACRAFLVFDPFVSPEYKVLLSPQPYRASRKRVKKDDAYYLVEWPPSPWKSWYEFSSSTGRWKEKAFVREGEAAGTARDLLQLNKIEQWGRHQPHWHYGAHWQGALYIHCRGEYVSRFSLLDNKYRVIKLPINLGDRQTGVRSFLGKSEKGVYIAAIANDSLAKLRVWTLNESGDQVKWVPKDQSNLKTNARTWWNSEDDNIIDDKKKLDKMKYWILDHDINNGMKNQEVSLEQNICWNSEDDNTIDDSNDEEEGSQYIKFLGFHPYKEIIFLNAYNYAVVFHLNSPKVQYLGSVKLHNPLITQCLLESFVYTPCLIGH